MVIKKSKVADRVADKRQKLGITKSSSQRRRQIEKRNKLIRHKHNLARRAKNGNEAYYF